MSWVDAQGATLSKLQERGGIWVVETLPEAGASPITQWVAKAKPKASVLQLMAQWAKSGRIGELPHPLQARQAYFERAMRDANGLVLTVRDAHNLRGNVLDKMRLFAEKRATVVLQGDVARIRVAGDEYKGFYQRATYVVQVDRLF